MVAARRDLKTDLDRLMGLFFGVLSTWRRACDAIVCYASFTQPVLLVLALTIVTAMCQEKAVEEGEPKEPILKSQIMVIALGPVPARKYSKDKSRGDAFMLLPELGEVPPSQLYYKAEDHSSTASSKWRPLRIAFNNVSVMRDITAGRNFLLYRKRADNYEPYVIIPPAGDGIRRIVLLTPASLGSNQTMPWHRKPKVTIIAMGSPHLRDKQFAIKNLSQKDVLHAFDQELANVRPGQLIAYKRNRNGVLYHLAARYGSERKMIYNLAVNFERDSSLHLYVLYDALPTTNAGRSVGVFRMVL